MLYDLLQGLVFQRICVVFLNITRCFLRYKCISSTHNFSTTKFTLNFKQKFLTFLWNFQYISGVYMVKPNFQSINHLILHSLLLYFFLRFINLGFQSFQFLPLDNQPHIRLWFQVIVWRKTVITRFKNININIFELMSHQPISRYTLIFF